MPRRGPEQPAAPAKATARTPVRWTSRLEDQRLRVAAVLRRAGYLSRRCWPLGVWAGPLLVAVAASTVLVAGVGVARADVSPLAWSGNATIDTQPQTVGEQIRLGPISCVGAGLCVAVDQTGHVVTSTDPTGGSVAWTPARVETGFLTGISCPTVSLCVAVDSAGSVVTSTDPTGGPGGWTVTPVDSANQLDAVSCASASLCVAVDNAGNVVTSTTPTAGAQAWHVASIDDHRMWSVSCPSASLCVAVGDAPSSVFTSTNPAGGSAAWQATTVTGLTQGLQTISCPSTTSCVALDGGANIVTSANPTGGTAAWSLAAGPSVNTGFLTLSCTSAVCVAVGLNGHLLTSTNPAGGAAAWAVSDAPDAPAALTGVACTSAGLCAASAQAGGVSDGELITTTDPTGGGAAWTVVSVDPTNSLFGVACPLPSACFAVDRRGNVLSSTEPGGGVSAWSLTHVTGTSLYGIACPATSECVAVDYAGNVLSSQDPTGDRSAWTVTSVDGNTPINAVTCPSSAFCAAVDDNGNVITSNDPTGGSGAWHVTNIDGTVPLGAVACASPSLCVAVDDNGDVISSTDPSGGAGAWHLEHVDGVDAFNGIACPSTTLCVAVDDAGNVVTSTNPTGGAGAWSVASVDPGSSLDAISCSSSAQCVAVDDAGNEVNSIGPAGGASVWTGAQVGVPSGTPFGGPAIAPLEAISCPAEARCLAVDAAGNAYVGQPTPSSQALPTVSGTATVGQTLHEAHGSWTDSPTGLNVVWERCDAAGNNCSAIQGAEGQAYALTAADAGTTIRAVEAASNANGDGTPAESTPTAVVTWQLPVNTSPPQAIGNPSEGQTLAETPGSWANVPTGYSYQWDDCDSVGNSCSPIAGANARTYTLAAHDVGHTIRVQEIASNPGGASAPASSAPTGIVQVAPGTSGTATVGRSKVTGASASVSVSCTGGPGAVCKLALILTVTESIKGGRVIAITAASTTDNRIHKERVTLGTAATTLNAGRSQTITIALNRAGKRLLAQHRTLKVRLAVTENGQPVLSSTITFKSKPKPTKRGSH